VLDTVCRQGARLAEPGEFTLRAFLAGRLDLTQAEAVLGVIDATGREELDVALRQMAGGLAGPLAGLRENLLQLLAELEAGLDFVDEPIQFISRDELITRLDDARREVTELSDQMMSRDRDDCNCLAVLTGQPNAGKSSLFNALAARYARHPAPSAIVSAFPGTTRDYVTADLSIDGTNATLVDTAGGGDAHQIDAADPIDPIDAAAQRLAAVVRLRAAVRIACTEQWPIEESVLHGAQIAVVTKCDLAHRISAEIPYAVAGVPVIITSSKTEVGIDRLAQCLCSMAIGHGARHSTSVVRNTALRCSESLRLAGDALERAFDLAAAHGPEELIAAEVRGALLEIGKTVGAVYTDDVLDRIFSKFCIGK
jgi:tRNA modification GTPase